MKEKEEEQIFYRENYPYASIHKHKWPPDIPDLYLLPLWIIGLILGLFLVSKIINGTKELLAILTGLFCVFICGFMIYINILQVKSDSSITVKDEGIYLRGWPHNHLKHFVSFDNVSGYRIETNNAYRYGTTIMKKKRDPKDYRPGCHGIRIQYTNGDEVFIGSDHAEDLFEAVQEAMQLKKSGGVYS